MVLTLQLGQLSGTDVQGFSVDFVNQNCASIEGLAVSLEQASCIHACH